MADKKSVIQIDIQDAAWKRFTKAFSKFKIDNKQVAEEIEKTANTSEKVAKAKKEILATQTKQNKLSREEKEEKEAQEKAERKLYDAERKRFALKSKGVDDRRRQRADDLKHLRDSAKWTADIAANVARTAYNAAKWVAFSAIASGFGLGGLAANASSVRRTSQGLGLSTGELRAANVNFGKYINPEGALSNIADAQSDMGKRWILQNSLGINPEGKSSGEILAAALPKLVAAFRAGGGTLQGAQARGLTELVGIDDLRRLSVLTEKELSETIEAYRRDRAALTEGDATGRAWQDFLVSLHRAGNQIEVSLLKGLTKLTPYLTQFANGITKAIDAFVSNGGLQNWIERFGAGLQRLGAYLGSKEFGQDVETFLRAVHKMAQVLGKMFSLDDGSVKATAAEAAPVAGASKWEATKRVYGGIWGHLVGNDKSGRVSSLEKQYKIPASLLDTVWMLESGRGRNNGLSSAGAGGDFQIMPGVAANLGVRDRWDFNQSSEGAAKLLRQLLDRYHGDAEKALAAYNWRPSALDADIAANGRNWRQHAPAETQAYLARAGFKVVVENNTGGSAQATVAALAH